MAPPRTYLALGDRMSSGLPAGVVGASIARQVHSCLEDFGWRLDDRTSDGCRVGRVPRDGHGDIVTLAFGGQDLVGDQERPGLDVEGFAVEHLRLLEQVRMQCPSAPFLIANLYAPPMSSRHELTSVFVDANERIAENARAVGGSVIDVASALRGRESLLLTPSGALSLSGASVFATLFLLELRRIGLLGP